MLDPAAFRSDSMFMNDTRFGLALCGVLGGCPLPGTSVSSLLSSFSTCGGVSSLASCTVAATAMGSERDGSESGLTAAGVVLAGRRRCRLRRGDQSLRVDRQAGARDRLLAKICQYFRNKKQRRRRVATALAVLARLSPLWLAADVNCLQCVGRQESGVAGLGRERGEWARSE